MTVIPTHKRLNQAVCHESKPRLHAKTLSKKGGHWGEHLECSSVGRVLA